jgi:hypothetical protein
MNDDMILTKILGAAIGAGVLWTIITGEMAHWIVILLLIFILNVVAKSTR